MFWGFIYLNLVKSHVLFLCKISCFVTNLKTWRGERESRNKKNLVLLKLALKITFKLKILF